jgi:hypothetical protein
MQHSYLFTEGEWEATGVLFDEEGVAAISTGGAHIHHYAECWEVESWMGDFENRYTLKPFDPQTAFAAWESINPAVGILKGLFVVAGETILSRYASDDGVLSGVESLRQVSADRYESRGAAIMGGQLLSRWEMVLVKKH